jgi:hypothetical protein
VHDLSRHHHLAAQHDDKLKREPSGVSVLK